MSAPHGTEPHSAAHRSVLVVAGSHQLPGPEPGTLSGAGTQPVMCNAQYTVQAAHVTQDKSFIYRRTYENGLRPMDIRNKYFYIHAEALRALISPSSDFKLVSS